ncbi:hypothetical protein CC80DRAFT_546687 [Byssothecium circinans]|uniref:Uncharacterized protein n=1 Tax=Byssothecium circinans TaxID=147558 RepID=A0A6A5U0R8_9PLEO|nr:hypothetical protein CC80DRAFT_546687 [Byssothecium circinans]
MRVTDYPGQTYRGLGRALTQLMDRRGANVRSQTADFGGLGGASRVGSAGDTAVESVSNSRLGSWTGRVLQGSPQGLASPMDRRSMDGRKSDGSMSNSLAGSEWGGVEAGSSQVDGSRKKSNKKKPA